MDAVVLMEGRVGFESDRLHLSGISELLYGPAAPLPGSAPKVPEEEFKQILVAMFLVASFTKGKGENNPNVHQQMNK